jgi:protein-S-isoprenylcysteine O-methyltransferase Ste14
MSVRRLRNDVIPALLTAVAGITTIGVILLTRGGLPVTRGVALAAGLPVLYLGMALFAWAARHLRAGVVGFVTPRAPTLVVTGPYRYVRHPVYAGTTVAMLGASLAARSLVGLLLTAVLFLPVEIHRARLEDRALHERFGVTWQTYPARTGFFLPHLHP